MKIEFSKSYIRVFNKRFRGNSSLKKQLRERTEIFVNNPTFPLLHNHALKGDKKGLRSFSVTGDIRIIYYIQNNIAYFVDIGSHNQVY